MDPSRIAPRIISAPLSEQQTVLTPPLLGGYPVLATANASPSVMIGQASALVAEGRPSLSGLRGGSSARTPGQALYDATKGGARSPQNRGPVAPSPARSVASATGSQAGSTVTVARSAARSPAASPPIRPGNPHLMMAGGSSRQPIGFGTNQTTMTAANSQFPAANTAGSTNNPVGAGLQGEDGTNLQTGGRPSRISSISADTSLMRGGPAPSPSPSPIPSPLPSASPPPLIDVSPSPKAGPSPMPPGNNFDLPVADEFEAPNILTTDGRVSPLLGGKDSFADAASLWGHRVGGSVNLPINPARSRSVPQGPGGSMGLPMGRGGGIRMPSGGSANLPVGDRAALLGLSPLGASRSRQFGVEVPVEIPLEKGLQSTGAVHQFSPLSAADYLHSNNEKAASVVSGKQAGRGGPGPTALEQEIQELRQEMNAAQVQAIAPQTALQQELQELRREVEKQYAQHQEIDSMAQRNMILGEAMAQKTHQEIDSMAQRSMILGEAMVQKSLIPGEDRSTARMPPISAPTGMDSPSTKSQKSFVRQVQQVQDMTSNGLENEVKQLCATIASQQAEQAVMNQMLRGELDDLQQQVHALREVDIPDVQSNLRSTNSREVEEVRTLISGHQQWRVLQEKTALSVHAELDTLTQSVASLKHELKLTQDLAANERNATDGEMRKLRLEVDGKISEQEAHFGSFQTEIENMQAHARRTQSEAMASQRVGNSSLVDDVLRMARCIEDLRDQHGSLISDVEADMQALRSEFGEKQAQSNNLIDDRLAEFRTWLMEHQKEVFASLQTIQSNVDGLRNKQESDLAEAAKANSGLVAQAQSDMQTIRELIGKGGGQAAPQELFELIRKLQTEIEYVGRKQSVMEADMAQDDSSYILQTQSELKEVRSIFQEHQTLINQTAMAQQKELQAQRLEVNEMQSQLRAQAANVAGVREDTALAMRQSFEEQLQQQAEAVNSLNDQVAELSELTKQALPAVHQLPTPVIDCAATPNPDNDVAALRSELEALKLQIAMQRSLRTAEVAKESSALHGRVQKAVGTEREARMQETLEMRTLIKNLYDEMSQVSQALKTEQLGSSLDSILQNRARIPSADPARRSQAPSLPSTAGDIAEVPRSFTITRSPGDLERSGYPTSEMDPADTSIKHLEVTQFIGVSTPDPAGGN